MLADEQRLALGDPLGILVYGDAERPTRFYYASTRPAVACGSDGYLLSLVRYDQPVQGHVGMLSLVVDLQPGEARMQALRQALATHCGRSDLQLLPMPWIEGSVSAALQGGAPQSFVPSLLGGNRVVLSMALNLAQYAMLTACAGRSSAAPLSVVYSLAYEVLRPAWRQSVQFDAEKFRHWMQERSRLNLLFIDLENVQTFEQMRQGGVLSVVGEDQSGQPVPDGLRRAFLRSLQSTLTALPSFSTPEAQEQGGSWGLGFEVSRLQDIQHFASRLDTDLQVQAVVARKAFIQGTLDGLDDALSQRPAVQIPRGGSFMQRLAVRCHDSFDGRPLNAVGIRFEPADAKIGSRVFPLADAAWQVELPHLPGKGGQDRTCYCDLYLGEGLPRGLVAAVKVQRSQAFLDIVPASFYTYRRYQVQVAEGFPWALVSSMQVWLQGPPGLSLPASPLRLTQASPTGEIEVFAPTVIDLGDVRFCARVQPYAQWVGARALEGLPAGSTIFLNPFRRRTVRFRLPEDFDWQRIPKVELRIDSVEGVPPLSDRSSFVLRQETPHCEFIYWYLHDSQVSFHAAFMPAGAAHWSTTARTRQPEVLLRTPEPVVPSTHPTQEQT